MRVRLAAALATLIGCAGEPAPAAPEQRTVETLAAVHLAEARAELAGEDVDSARSAALAQNGATLSDFDRWLDRAARDPEAGEALWAAVAAALDSSGAAGDR
jgi:hypothetical protein